MGGRTYMNLDTKKKRLWFTVWCVWSSGWLAAYVIGGFYELNDCKAHLSALMNCEYDFKLGGFIFIAVVIPLILLFIASAISKIKTWVSSGS